MQLTLSLEEAQLLLRALQSSKKHMQSDSRHREDIRRVESLIIRMEAEIKVEKSLSSRQTHRW